MDIVILQGLGHRLDIGVVHGKYRDAVVIVSSLGYLGQSFQPESCKSVTEPVLQLETYLADQHNHPVLRALFQGISDGSAHIARATSNRDCNHFVMMMLIS